MINLNSKVAIITGSTSGIGKSCAQKLSQLGATVIVSGRRKELGEKVSKSLSGESCFIRADMSKEEEIKNLVSKTKNVTKSFILFPTKKKDPRKGSLISSFTF